MATMRDTLTRFWGKSGSADSAKAREVVKKAYEKSGGPTPELKRVYGAYLKYKREKLSPSKG